MKNFFFENFNHLIIREFSMAKIWTYFHKSIWVVIFIFIFNFFVPIAYVFESFT
jgi:hypothetical protein